MPSPEDSLANKTTNHNQKEQRKVEQKSLTAFGQSELFSIEVSAEWSCSAAELDSDFSGLISRETAQFTQVPVSETLGPFCPTQSFTVNCNIIMLNHGQSERQLCAYGV